MNNIESLLDGLNQVQKEAVMYIHGPLLILAGAGTGKTKVITMRIANILDQGLTYPKNILAVTFTNKASNEMLSRLSEVINCDGLNVGTFHSIAAKILRKSIHYLDNRFTSNFTITNADDQLKLIKNIAKSKNIDTKMYAPKLISIIIARWKDSSLTVDKMTHSDIQSSINKIAYNIYQTYQAELIASNCVDFGDLLLFNNELFINNPTLLEFYQNQYQYILIDEYQDINVVQYLWSRMLASKFKNICCVGDDDQSIYSWRGAEVANILRFNQDFPNAKVIKLEQNYRSTNVILTAASSLIQNNKNRHHKSLWTENNISEKIKIISCWDDREESRFIASEIKGFIKNSKYDANQIAILIRAGFQTRIFEEIFISNSIPYQIIGGLKFYERMEIRDLLAYIRLILNYNDNLALERIINVPKRSIGDTTLRLIKEYADDHNISGFIAIEAMLNNGLFKAKVHNSLYQFVNLIYKLSELYKSDTAFNATKEILEQSGYLAMWKSEKSDESRARIENINEILRVIAEFKNIEDFLEHSSLVMDNDSLESDFGGKVNIMTLHASKGLEFDLVFLPGWEENLFPHQKALLEEGDHGLEEERRIAYVGITRAKKDLYITYAENRRIFHQRVQSLPSRFLNELPDDICVKISSTKTLNYVNSRHNVSLSNTSMSQEHNKARKGSSVVHNIFGQGIVIAQHNENLEIIFENDPIVKTIKQSYVKFL